MMHLPSFLIRDIQLANFLSFGPHLPALELRNLNVLIGPNGSGKSNLLEAVNLMRAAPKELRDVTLSGGGVDEWIWKGNAGASASVVWTVEDGGDALPIRHSIAFTADRQSFSLVDERIDYIALKDQPRDDTFYYRYQQGHPELRRAGEAPTRLGPGSFKWDRSILAQRRDPERFPEISWLADNYERIRIYREWTFGRRAIFREPQRADVRNDVLLEDFSNLGLFLNRLKTKFPTAKRALLEALSDLYDGLSDFDVSVEGGTVQVFFTEGDYVIPATRLSDGTLRYLCLLAILCDPQPPPLICIEEPELGLHPDILHKLADLLKAAAERTQLIVTTHSEILVDALSATPEVVIVCSKVRGQTVMERLDATKLSEWLERYSLGELWRKGEIGGTRW